MSQSNENLVWIDLEMTGLNPESDRIIEMAALITDPQLMVLAESPVFTVHQSDEVLNTMDEWNTKQHGKSGLTQRVRESHVNEGQAELEMLTFLRAHVPENTSPMCGSGICQDRRFLARHMPLLEKYFHYRNLDVSTIKELAKRWAPSLTAFDKTSAHLALDDIRDSVAELVHYRKHLFTC